MDRRTFVRVAAAVTGSATLAGCFDDEASSTPELGEESDGPPRYDLPQYSELAPAETHTGDGVVVAHLRLSVLGAVQEAHEAGRFSDEPVVTLSLSGVDPILEAVETLSAYPFAVPLRRAVNDAAGRIAGGNGNTTNDTLVAPGNRTLGGERTNGTVAENGTIENATTENGTVENGTTENRTANATAGNTTANATAGNTTAESRLDGSETGIEVDEITLADGVLYFHGSYDRSIVEARYTRGFEQVDELRKLAIYEDGSGLSFAVGEDLLVVPTEVSDREATATAVLAHTLSGYTTTVDRIVDDEDGQWLFGTTGLAAFSLGVWGADNPRARVGNTVGTEPERTDPVFDTVEGFIVALEPTVEGTETVTGAETRFAGVFPAELPTEAELRSALVGDRDDAESYREPPRAHLSASLGGR